MSYFNHSFTKNFVATGNYIADNASSTTDLEFSLSAGADFGFFDPRTYIAANSATFGQGCPLILASAGFYSNDKIGPFHGGYQESNKSKIINPKYVTKFYRVDYCDPQASQVLIGETNETIGDSGCCKEFLCDETYNLRVDIKGSPALQTLTRNAYLTVSAYTGCCADPDEAPVEANALHVYTQWAYQLLSNITINPFIQVHITYTTDGGDNWAELGDGTNSAANLAELLSYINGTTAYPASIECVGTANDGAGLIIDGAYIDTRFSDCTFYPTDGMKAYLEPVQIFASEVDLNGDPCEFTGLCTSTQCTGIQQTGSGEVVARDVIMTEAYRQQPMHTGSDLRIREITQGNQILDAVDRTSFYTRYYIEHVVPRFNNPSGVFDNDRYLLCLIMNAPDATFEGDIEDWLLAGQGTSCVTLQEIECYDACTPAEPVVEEVPG
jgi:hypothetical protein